MNENDENDFYYQIYYYIFEKFIEQNKVISLQLLLKYHNIKNAIEDLKKEVLVQSPDECNNVYSITDSIASPEQERLQANVQSPNVVQQNINVSSGNNVQNQRPSHINSQQSRTTVLTSLTINSSFRFSSPPNVKNLAASHNELPSDDEWHHSSVNLQFSPEIYPNQQFLQIQQLNSNKDAAPQETIAKDSNIITASRSKKQQDEQYKQQKTSPELTLHDLNTSQQPSFIVGSAVIKDNDTKQIPSSKSNEQLINKENNEQINIQYNTNSPQHKSNNQVIFNIETPIVQQEKQNVINNNIQLINPKIIKEKRQNKARLKKYKKQNYQIYTYQQLTLALKKIGLTYQSRQQAIDALEKAQNEKISSPIALTQYEILPDSVRIAKEQQIKQIIIQNPFWHKQIIQHIPINSKLLLQSLKDTGVKGISQGFLDQYLLRQGVLTVYSTTPTKIVKLKHGKNHRQLTLSQMRQLKTRHSK